ncbi:MAG: amidohydrolase [Enterobacterales bacterium]|nr:amidohydrolase [Enterobacterales bacterium]
MKILRFYHLHLLTLSIVLLVSACSQQAAKPIADSIYFGGPIISMQQNNISPKALAVHNGKIIAVGVLAKIENFKGKNTRMIDLKGHTLLPAFIDAHGHFSMVGLLSQSANLAAKPEGNTNDIAQLIKNLKAHKNSQQAKQTGWIIGMNYDDSQLFEQRHPTAKDLDRVSLERPVMIIHQSFHLGVLNTKALELVGYSASTNNPAGGVIRRLKGSQQPNGVLEEMAFFVAAMKIIKPKSNKHLFDMLQGAQQAYLAAGFTTVQEGRATPDNINGLIAASQQKQLEIDVAAYPDPVFYRNLPKFKRLMAERTTNYHNHFRIAGIKLSLDGSPQGKTAWLSHPYYRPPAGKTADYKGYSALKNEALDNYVTLAYKKQWQVLVHSNGDAASDQFIAAIDRVQKVYPDKDLRPMIIHAQVIREDQLDALKRLNVIPSFMSVHTFYWGDWHRESVLGGTRAKRISPAKSALKKRNSLHQP